MLSGNDFCCLCSDSAKRLEEGVTVLRLFCFPFPELRAPLGLCPSTQQGEEGESRVKIKHRGWNTRGGVWAQLPGLCHPL